MVWKCCPLALVDEAFGDMTVWRRDRALGAAWGSQTCWLTEKTRLAVNGREIRVGVLEQVELERYAARKRAYAEGRQVE